MSTTLFVYGTLMYPDVFVQVSGCAPDYEKATLHDFCPRKLLDRPYPGLIPCKGYQTEGLLLYDLQQDTMNRLDAYEGEEYSLEMVEIIARGQSISAQVYVLATAFYELLTTEIWLPEQERL